MAVNYYATEAELEEKMARTFDATSTPTSAKIATMLDQLSSQLDGVLGRTEGYFGTSATAPEWVKQAVLSVGKMYVDSFEKESDPPSEEEIVTFFRLMSEDRDVAHESNMLFYFQDRPNSSGNW